tara:strand:- start:5 stop:679 length:675 start_codon:yes stop_codon:yes gene_type:complete
MKHLLSSTAFLVVNKRLAKRVGLKEAILLADLISKEHYFIDNQGLRNGWFFNTSKNIEEDTTLTNYQQKKAIKNLEKFGFIKTELKGMPATLHFKILENKIASYLKTSFEETLKQDSKKLKTNKNKEIRTTNKSLSIRAQEFTEEVFMSNLETEVCQDFVDYWTETNKSNTKMKFELQKTFDIKRRLARWVSNNKKWNIKQSSKIDQQLDNYQKAIDIIKKSNL